MSKGRFLKPKNGSKITVTKEKERRKKRASRSGKEEKKIKSNGCTLSFYNGYFGDSFWPKKLLDANLGSFGGNVIKNPARNIFYINFT